MKYLGFLLFFVAVYHGVSSQFTPVDMLSRLDSIPGIRSISEMVRKNCQEKDAEFKAKLEDMQKCYLDFKGKETFCGMIRNHLVNCTKPMVDAMEKCLETKYQDVPRFLIDVVESAAEYICKSKGEKLIELLHPCLTTMGYDQSKVCLKSFNQKLENIDKDTSITNVKIDICKSLETTKACFLKGFKKTCNNDITMEAAVGFYDSVVTKPCKH